MSEDPHIPFCSVATDASDLHAKLLSGDLPAMPFWLQVGNESFRITEENRRELARGILLGMDLSTYE